ncbi:MULTISPECIES: immunoglobulin-like domain-containing protein [unclassified Rathayibacter]|uniref:immunoglobulin-like domain-containing protein n=1 Tax=unclassified Rathayibacter TaxID=2609250 RepID=UPI00188D3B93|nr:MULTISPECIES: immunoglobulin-like domain-containing protein [unclassified Rathayibacter]MBF4461142.1 Ig-like domain-containing protein [Rathayibacter sp. VKM Ac-2879]MBF4502553.1 Ig-like domain-containing protein [Rathayibacter sp. VKM Ac-2878]
MTRSRSVVRTALTVATVAATALLGATVPNSAFGATPTPLLHYTFDTAPTGTTIADASGNGYNATLRGSGATFGNGQVSLPGGSASTAPYLDIPTAGLVGKKDLTFSTWLSNRSGSGNVAAAFVGAPVASGSSFSSGYWLLNPSNPQGYVKSVVTNATNAGSPWTTEVGPGATNTATAGARTPTGLSLYTTVIDGTSGTLTVYVNGTQIGQNAIARTVSSFGSSLVASIARSTYNDPGWSGDMDDFAVYDSALGSDAVKALYSSQALDRAVASVTIPTEATADFALPTTSSGVAIAWRSNSSAIAVNGGSAVVARPAAGSADASVTLTASYSVGSVTRSVDYPVTVAAQLADSDTVQRDLDAISIPNVGDIRTDVTVPQRGAAGSTLTWSAVSPTGVTVRAGSAAATSTLAVERPAAGSAATDVVVRVTATSGAVTRSRDITLRLTPLPTGTDDTQAYVWAFFTGEGAGAERVSLAASQGNDALAWNTLNGGQPVFTSTQGTQGLRDPFIIRSHEGDKFFMLATDLKVDGLAGGFTTAQISGSKHIEVWESTDLVTWSAQRHVKVSSDFAGNTWAPEAYWDDELGTYVVFWASNMYPTANAADRTGVTYNQMMYATTDDFVTFSEAKPWIDVQRGAGKGTIDSTITKDGDTYYRFTKDEASMTLREEKSTELLATESGSLPGPTGPADEWTLVKERVASGLPNGEPGGTFTSGEGPNVFPANTNDVNGLDWFLFIDQPDYHGGPNHYIPFGSDDLADGDSWQPLGAKLRSGLPQNLDGGKPRHGTVIPVTRAEYQKVLEGFAPGIAVASVAPLTATTTAGTAPVLPRAAITTAAGTTSTVDVVWEAVAPASYATPGTFTVSGVAQDASRMPVQATVTVQPSLKVTAAASSRCLAGKVVLTVVATNGDTVPMDVSIRTSEGVKTFAGVKPGASASAAYTVRASQLAAGTATVTATATVGGATVVATATAAYGARSCG